MLFALKLQFKSLTQIFNVLTKTFKSLILLTSETMQCCGDFIRCFAGNRDLSLRDLVLVAMVVLDFLIILLF